jgi:hypothetical protein
MDDIENRGPVTVARSIIAVAAFVAMLTYTSAALAKEEKRRGNYWHRVCASQTSAHVLRCRGHLQRLYDGLTVFPSIRPTGASDRRLASAFAKDRRKAPASTAARNTASTGDALPAGTPKQRNGFGVPVVRGRGHARSLPQSSYPRQQVLTKTVKTWPNRRSNCQSVCIAIARPRKAASGQIDAGHCHRLPGHKRPTNVTQTQTRAHTHTRQHPAPVRRKKIIRAIIAWDWRRSFDVDTAAGVGLAHAVQEPVALHLLAGP